MGNHMTELQGVAYHMGSHVLLATRHKWTHPALTPADKAGTQFTYPRGIEGWVDLGDLIMPWPGVEATTTWSMPWLLRHQYTNCWYWVRKFSIKWCIYQDVRSRSVMNTYTDDSAVRDVQLNPLQPVNFATACEDGSIRVRFSLLACNKRSFLFTESRLNHLTATVAIWLQL